MRIRHIVIKKFFFNRFFKWQVAGTAISFFFILRDFALGKYTGISPNIIGNNCTIDA